VDQEAKSDCGGADYRFIAYSIFGCSNGQFTKAAKESMASMFWAISM
jgi:hypothetical protein